MDGEHRRSRLFEEPNGPWKVANLDELIGARNK